MTMGFILRTWKWVIPIANESPGVVGSLQSSLIISSVLPVGSTV